MRTILPILALVVTVLAVLGLGGSVNAATIKPGQSFFGYSSRTEYIQGNLPVIIVVPHGGILVPSTLPDRNASCVRQAVGTIELTRRVMTRLQKQTGGYPFVAICHLHRSKLDINTNILEETQNLEEAGKSWSEIHGWINATSAKILSDYGFGQIISIGGQTHAANTLEIGMGIPTDAFNGDDANLLVDAIIGNSTLRNLYAPENFTDLLRGHRSFGGLFANFTSTPSPDHPHPRNWNEDWFIRCHGSSGQAETLCPFTGGQGKIGAIQLDVPVEIRTSDSEEAIEEYSDVLADALVDWLSIWYRTPLRRNNDVQEPSFWKSPTFVIVLVSVLIAAVIIAVLVLVIRNRNRPVPFTQLTEENAVEIAPTGAL